jgi:hypothetical protein
MAAAREWPLRSKPSPGYAAGVAAHAEDLDRSYRSARSRWTRLTVRTVVQVRDAYGRATDALAARIEQTLGAVTRHTRTAVFNDLTIASTLLNIETLALLQRGIATTAQDASTQALVGQLPLAPLAGTATMRTKLQSTAEATALAFISRTGADGLQLSDRVWRSLDPWQTAITRTVEQGIITGQSHKDLARDLRQYVSPAAITPKQIEEAQKRGIAPVPTWQTERLARTEINAASREATIMTNQTNPFYRGVQWIVSPRIRRGSYPICQICHDLAAGTSDRAPGSKPMPDGDGRYYPRGSEPTPAASHPSCRCSLVPVYDDLDTVTSAIGDWLENPASEPELQAWSQWMQTPTPEIPQPVPPAQTNAPPATTRVRTHRPPRIRSRRSLR